MRPLARCGSKANARGASSGATPVYGHRGEARAHRLDAGPVEFGQSISGQCQHALSNPWSQEAR